MFSCRGTSSSPNDSESYPEYKKYAEYDLFWEKVTKMASELEINEAKLTRKRKVPRRYDSGHAEAEFHSSPKGYITDKFTMKQWI